MDEGKLTQSFRHRLNEFALPQPWRKNEQKDFTDVTESAESTDNIGVRLQHS